MRKRYIVAVNSSTKEQVESFIEFIKANGLGWWHWLDNIWLLTDSAGILNAKKVRDEVSDTFPNINNLVIELNETGDTWSGFGPNSDKRNMFNWLKKTWIKYK
jgi:hypothetical protein